MIHKTIHRKYTGWEFRAIELQTVIDEKHTAIIYGLSRTKKEDPWEFGLELYRGPHFIPDSKDKNWSRRFTNKGKIPTKYLPYVDQLRNTFANTQFDNHSEFINEN